MPGQGALLPAAHEPPSGVDAAARRRGIALELRASTLFSTYQKDFEAATGLPLDLRVPGSFRPPLDGALHQNPFCRLLTRNNQTCAACLCCQQQLETAACNGTVTLSCHAGLVESAIPVRAGGEIIAYLQTGQVRFLGTPELGPRTRPDWIRPFTGEAAKRIRAVYRATPIVSRERYESQVQLLEPFARQLGALAAHRIEREAPPEPPLAVRFREFIARHHEDDLPLAQAAAGLNMSPYYFCKMFKKLLGVSFTRYLSQLRVDSVRRQLAYSHMRICDAAFGAGFQSLSQFNRVFRQLTGQTPREFRRQARASHALGLAS